MQKNHLLIGCLAAALCSTAALPAQAQATFSYGPRVGFQRTYQSAYYPESEILYGPIQDTPRRYGFQAGVGGNMQFRHLAIQPAVVYSQKGYRYAQQGQYRYQNQQYTTHRTMEETLNYVEVPINLVASLKPVGGLQLMLGGYAAVGVSGRLKSHSYIDETPNGEFGYYVSGPDGKGLYSEKKAFGEGLQRFDLGVNGGVGYQYNAWQVQAIYGMGLLNINHTNQSSPYGPSLGPRNRSLQLTATYFFSPTR